MKMLRLMATACPLLLLSSCGDDAPLPAVPEADTLEIRGHLAEYDLSAAKTSFNKLEQDWMSREGVSRSALDPIWDEIESVEEEIRAKRREGYERFEGEFVQKSEIDRILKERADEKERRAKKRELEHLAAQAREEERIRTLKQRKLEEQAEAERQAARDKEREPKAENPPPEGISETIWANCQVYDEMDEAYMRRKGLTKKQFHINRIRHYITSTQRFKDAGETKEITLNDIGPTGLTMECRIAISNEVFGPSEREEGS